MNEENVLHTKESFKGNLANHGNLSALLCFIPIERLDPCLADIHFMLWKHSWLVIIHNM